MISLKCIAILLLATLLNMSAGTGNQYCRIKDQNIDCPSHKDPCNKCVSPSTIKYRTFDGTCNHPENLGAESDIFDNLLPQEYDDGSNTPRQRGRDSQPLTSARNVSLNIHTEKDVSAAFPILMMQWGQWLAHDFTATKSAIGTVSCCGPNGGCPPFVTDRDCFPVQVPPNDPTFPGICLNFVRSAAANGSDCLPLRPRRQINTVTAFLDCSQIYGSTNDVAASLREPGGFLLRTKFGKFPPEANSSVCRKRNNTNDYCFLAGDSRANQHTYLSAFHTLWLREHNYIATELNKLKPDMSAEDKFQTTRRIIIGMHQVFTYNTFLPIMLGEDAKRWQLTSTYGRSFYNPSLSPRISSAFSVGAFRFGHSTTPSRFPIGNRSVPLRHLFNSPGLVLDEFDGIMAGMIGLTYAKDGRVQTSDKFITDELSRFLFFNNATGRGFDLNSVDIQRGRDHGVPPYVKWRSFCGLRPLTGFNDTEALGPYASDLAKYYRSIEDVDLFTGMLHEPITSGLVGPTIACLMRIQFYNTKYGDRFFCDNTEPNSGFTDAQLASLRAATLSQVICRHTSLRSIQRNVFKLASADNPLVPCSQLRSQGLNLRLFVQNSQGY